MRIDLPDFATQKELFEYLVKHEAEIVDLKKSEIKRADSVDFYLFDKSDAIKAEFGLQEQQSQDTDTEIKRTIVGNTYNWMDSHGDVHLSGIFANSIKQRGVNRINHLHDHVNQLSAKVGKFSNVYEKNMSWQSLGVNMPGETQALLADSSIKRALNKKIFDMYKADEIDQHSVGMRYITINLAVNDPNMAKQYAVWNAVFPKLGNPDRATKAGYLWAVKEAGLHEISAVLNGSNEITPTLPGPGKSTPQNKESQNPPPGSSEQLTKSNYYYFH